jgi:glycosyltransferase involved in cell wall biosynthesis
VTLAPTHVHGGANIIEGMEFGHVIIHFETHFNVFDDVGEKIDVPYHFYVPSSYGKDWKTFSQFRDILIADKKSGLFSQTTEDLAAALSRYMQNPSDLLKLRENVLKFAYAEYSLKNRNLALNRIYQSVVSQKE